VTEAPRRVWKTIACDFTDSLDARAAMALHVFLSLEKIESALGHQGAV
jgi:hypothetical protein